MVETTYTFFLRDESSAAPAFEIDLLEGPAAARIRALELLQDRPRYSSVEVSEAGKIFIVERPASSGSTLQS